MALTKLEEDYCNYIIDEAKNYKLNGMVLDYKMGSDASKKGMYLILSPNRDVLDGIAAGRVDFDSQLRLQESKGGMIYTNMYAFKIEPKNIHAIAKEAFRYMRDYELVRVCFTEKNLPVPFRIAKSTIEDIKEMNHNRKASSSYSLDEKMEKRYTDYLKRISKLCEKEDSFKAIYNKNRRQEVYTMDEFIKRVDRSEIFRLPVESIPDFKEFMKREPDATYYIGNSIKTTSFEIFQSGSQTKTKESTQKWVTISVDAAYTDLTYQFSLENLHKMGLDNSTYDRIDELARANNDELTFAYLPLGVIEEFSNWCNRENVPFVLDVDGAFGKPDSNKIPIVIRSKDEEKVNGVVIDINLRNIQRHKHYIESYQIGRNYEKENQEKQQKKHFSFGF